MNEFFEALKNRKARREYIKSMIVGIFSTAIDFILQAIILFIYGNKEYKGFMSVFSGETVSGVPFELPISIYMTSIVISFTVSILINYLLSVFFVYQYGNVGKNRRGFLKFLTFSAIGLGITSLGSLIGSAAVGLSGGNVWTIKIVITVVVFFFNFFTRKYFVFNIALIRDDENTINL